MPQTQVHVEPEWWSDHRRHVLVNVIAFRCNSPDPEYHQWAADGLMAKVWWLSQIHLRRKVIPMAALAEHQITDDLVDALVTSRLVKLLPRRSGIRVYSSAELALGAP